MIGFSGSSVVPNTFDKIKKQKAKVSRMNRLHQ